MFTIERVDVGRYVDPWEMSEEIITILNGCYVGSGVFGKTYKVGDEVIKIFQDDPGYTAYLVELSKQTKQNSFAPVINWVKVFDDGYEPTTMVSMEPLRTVYQLSQPMRNKFRAAVADIGNLVRGRTNLLRYKIPKELDELKVVIQTAKKNSSRDGYDLHDENVMLRSNNSVVITDPLAY